MESYPAREVPAFRCGCCLLNVRKIGGTKKRLLIGSGYCCCCCCLHIKSRSNLYSVLSNIRTGPTDANAFRGHRLTTQTGYTYRKEIKGPRKVNTHAIIGKENNPPQKNKAPDSQTSQATSQTKEIDRAHRSHSTREAKQNETNKKNQGSPIKTIKSHDSILVPLLGRGVFTAGFAPVDIYIYIYMCQREHSINKRLTSPTPIPPFF